MCSNEFLYLTMLQLDYTDYSVWNVLLKAHLSPFNQESFTIIRIGVTYIMLH